MKNAIRVLLLLLAMILPANGMCAPLAYTTEMLLDDWSNRYIDSAHWTSAWLEEAESPKATLPSENHIPQREALRCAVEAITQLGFEMPESLFKQYSVEFGFYYEELYDMYLWHISLYRWEGDRHLELYTIQVDANAGRIFSISSFGSFYAYDANYANYAYVVPKLPERYFEQAPSIDALIDHWDTLYSESPAYSPEVQRREMLGYPLPGEGEMTKREALRIALEMTLTLSGHGVEELYDCTPQVEFDVSPAASRWYITILRDAKGMEGQAVFSFTINATTQTMEKLTWRNMQS